MTENYETESINSNEPGIVNALYEIISPEIFKLENEKRKLQNLFAYPFITSTLLAVLTSAFLFFSNEYISINKILALFLLLMATGFFSLAIKIQILHLDFMILCEKSKLKP